MEFLQADFEKDPLPFTHLNGILMANALHFVSDKTALIDKLKKRLASDGRFLIVEYDTDNANPWVPYPISFDHIVMLFRHGGFSKIEKTGEHQSVYGGRKMYGCIAAP